MCRTRSLTLLAEEVNDGSLQLCVQGKKYKYMIRAKKTRLRSSYKLAKKDVKPT